ncbi:glycerate kinase [Proteiniclasticum aestuarii]|nr:glycerate kinase [Proteiniclasticum aestuarii]
MKESDDKMKIVVAVDSFKGSLTSLEAGEAIKEGILKAGAHEVIVKPLADGGEGTTEAFVTGYGGEFIRIPVQGPLGKEVHAAYGYLRKEKMAIMEMASSSGITLIREEEKNPMKTSTFGFGEMIIDALEKGCRRFLLGIGGSATNDGGIGMLTALGFAFLDQDGERVSPDGEGLARIRSVSTEHVHPLLSKASFQVACDVNNPLLGPNGATSIYGPQKGVTEHTKPLLEEGMRNYADVTAQTIGKDFRNHPGAGAAGGLGFALLGYLQAELKEGITLVLEAIGLNEDLQDADLVFTGEGRIDAQSAMGKAPGGVAQLAGKYGVKVIALGGSVSRDVDTLNSMGIHACFSILNEIVSLEEAMDKEVARKNLIQTAQQIMRLLDQ